MKRKNNMSFEIESIKCLSLKKNDILVVKFSGPVSCHAIDSLRSTFKRLQETNPALASTQILMMSGDTDLEVISRQETKPNIHRRKRRQK
jgi:hypothetical protein